ncbi:MAG TPA: SDR family NAD(P)-dependent oxidoreductase [Papillibacter sp.]|jgi:NAD(P)-dependent dehydrogenase (short-subunit alcohol dehydrogenase family)|nr:SDR family NAD(P)-dependent oxidoreductase [Papillibacter sp.]
MVNFTGKTAFITGGASGIGLGIAKACAKRGMNVVIADINKSAVDETVTLFENNCWPVLGLQLDVTDRAAYKKAADEAEYKFGKIHLLVNNAGIGVPEGKLWEDKNEDIDLAIDINYRGVLNGIKEIVPRILRHGEEGHVVSTASKAAIVPVPGFTLYNSLKMAVVTVMETLAVDLRETNVGSSVFCPGPYQSNLGYSSGRIRSERLGVEMPSFGAPKDGEKAPPPPRMDVDFTKVIRYPEDAGERVLRGVERGDLYIFTHADFKRGWDARAAAISKAFPDEPDNPDFQKVFPMLVYNPIYEKQEKVPGLAPAVK